MNKQGPGLILLSNVISRFDKIQVILRLYNFDINVSTLKDEHKKFLHDNVVPALKFSDLHSARLHGSASKSGEDNHNLTLSGSRAEEVRRILTAGGAGPKIKEVKALGEPPGAGANEDERDRAVIIFLDLPLEFLNFTAWTDDWARKLTQNDVVGRAGITKLNLQAEVTGAPRSWVLDSGLSIEIMPSILMFPFDAVRQGRKLDTAVRMQLAPPAAQDASLRFTLYRSSVDVSELGLPTGTTPGVATVYSGPHVDLGLQDHGWFDVGTAEIAGSTETTNLDARTVVLSGGADALDLRPPSLPRRWHPTVAVSRPADVLFFSGRGTSAGCLSPATECWVSPKELLVSWKNQVGPKVLILAAPTVLNMKVASRVAMGEPGVGWARLLKVKSLGGPCVAILGYRGPCPGIKDIEDIAKKMGAKIAGGLKDDQLVRTWLKINGDHPGRHTWQAVGMNDRGYWWIHERTWDEEIWDFVPGRGDKYAIKGPAAIAI